MQLDFHIYEKMEIEQAQHRPMITWLTKIAKERMDKGRLVLFENPISSSALKQTDLTQLSGYDDGLLDESFYWTAGDQCMLGQRDWETGTPFKAPTCWGTNGAKLRSLVAISCDGNHDHQEVRGSNCYGPRSEQKAIWPEEMCKTIITVLLL